MEPTAIFMFDFPLLYLQLLLNCEPSTLANESVNIFVISLETASILATSAALELSKSVRIVHFWESTRPVEFKFEKFRN